MGVYVDQKKKILRLNSDNNKYGIIMRIGIPKEIEDGELRVAMTPAVAERVKKLGFDLVIESGAGAAASYSDEAYEAVGVDVTNDTKALWHDSDVLIKVRPPVEHPELGFYGIELLGKDQTLISTLYPAQNTATPAPITSTFAGGTLPAAVI